MVTLHELITFLVSMLIFITTSTTDIYTLSLHDALPILRPLGGVAARLPRRTCRDRPRQRPPARGDPERKSTRLNSSHSSISYAVFCLKKKRSNHVLGQYAN